MGIWNLTKIDVVTDIRSSERTYKRHGAANCPLSFVLQHPLYPFPFPSPSFTEQRSFRLAVPVTVIFISTSIIPFSSIKMRFFALVAALCQLSLPKLLLSSWVVIPQLLTTRHRSVNATNGDVIQFQFVSKNHTLTQSSFAAPCTPLAGGVDSGFQAVATNATTFPVWSFTLTNTSAPLWFYCAQPLRKRWNGVCRQPNCCKELRGFPGCRSRYRYQLHHDQLNRQCSNFRDLHRVYRFWIHRSKC
ncbi:hypothetical protein C8R41DRAFT_201465 [Lentinula lateritia]|uniref:Cupredoxin n=1 Tax=Lentinula lateritia TaxID=40482 RepID=A0ABQ8W0F7_9AGAR|nr:hypothetical protein C8R41DRAFT_201465 [Lentinula lateritia]